MTDPAPIRARPQPSPVAMISLVLGVASLLLPIVAGVPALFVGYRALYAINASDERLIGKRLAIAGMVLGGLTTFLALFGFVILIFVRLTQSSRFVECQNNLGRVGFAVNVYHDNSPGKVYPTAAIPDAALPVAERLSWDVSILPYLDQNHPAGRKWQGVYEPIDLKRRWDDPVNAASADTVISAFLCPNNPNYNPPVRPAPTHHIGISGVGSEAAFLKMGDGQAGFFGYDRVIQRNDVSAGISHTLMALETSTENGPWIRAGFSTVRGIHDEDRLIGLNAPFGGCHAGGMNALFVDGSVRFESDRIEPKILRELARIARE